MGYAMSSRSLNEGSVCTMWETGDGTTEVQFSRALFISTDDANVLYRNDLNLSKIHRVYLMTIGRKDADAGSNASLLFYLDGVSQGGSTWTDAVESKQLLSSSVLSDTGIQEVKLKFNMSDTDNLLLKYVKFWYIKI